MLYNIAMAEKIIPVDPNFAQLLDLNCKNCRNDYSDNQPQLRVIQSRKEIVKEGEKRALNGIEDQCKRCFKTNKNYIDSISASSSCTWRAGI